MNDATSKPRFSLFTVMFVMTVICLCLGLISAGGEIGFVYSVMLAVAALVTFRRARFRGDSLSPMSRYEKATLFVATTTVEIMAFAMFCFLFGYEPVLAVSIYVAAWILMALVLGGAFAGATYLLAILFDSSVPSSRSPQEKASLKEVENPKRYPP